MKSYSYSLKRKEVFEEPIMRNEREEDRWRTGSESGSGDE